MQIEIVICVIKLTLNNFAGVLRAAIFRYPRNLKTRGSK